MGTYVITIEEKLKNVTVTHSYFVNSFSIYSHLVHILLFLYLWLKNQNPIRYNLEPYFVLYYIVFFLLLDFDIFPLAYAITIYDHGVSTMNDLQ